MKTFILMWNPAISNYKREDFEQIVPYEYRLSWSIWDYKEVERNDLFYMVKVGEGNTGIVLAGRIRGNAQAGEDWSGRGRQVYYADLNIEFASDFDTPFISTEQLMKEIPGFDWNGGHSGRLLSDDMAEKLETLFDKYFRKKVAVKKFFRPIHHKRQDLCRPTDLYKSEVGWHSHDYHDAMTTEPEGVLRYYLETGYDFEFFDSVTLSWYCIDNRYKNRIALSRIRPNENWDGKYLEESQGFIGWLNSKDIPDVIFKCETVDEFLKGATIDGTPISEVMTRSWIVYS